MKRAHQLMRVWNWLPVFRAVAETQRIVSAAEMLNVTSAAVSKTISKLEEALGVKLFDRVHRGMLLSSAGMQLLDEVREAMRQLDDVIQNLAPTKSTTNVTRVAFESHAVGSLIHQGLPQLVASRKHLSFEFKPVAKMAAALLLGDMDLGLATAPSSDERILCKSLGQFSSQWVTLGTDVQLPPQFPESRLQLTPAIDIPSVEVLRHVAMLLPTAIPFATRCRRAQAQPLTLFRLTRTRPEKHLLSLANIVMATAAHMHANTN